jgi:hypothetical protein
MSKDDYPVAVYCLNPRYDIHNDYRLLFLAKQGIKVDYIYSDFGQNSGRLNETMHSLFQRSLALKRGLSSNDEKCSSIRSRLLGQMSGIFGILLYKLTRRKFYDPNWANYILEKTEARALCFDHVMPGLFVVDAFLKAAREMSIPVLSLPHGIFLYTNEVTKAKSTDSRRFSKFNRFDYIIVPNRLRKELLARSGVTNEKIFVLGSARFCNEWLEQNNKIIPRMIESNLANTGKLKLVFMPSKPRCRIDVERMHNTIEILASFSAIDAVVKPHTRTGREKHVFSNMPLADVSHIHTPELCEWADVVLVIGTSVITEALMRGKPALYLKYLHANTTLFEELGACWTIHNEAELKEALSSLQSNKTRVPYGEENAARFLAEIVYGGGSDKDVLRGYEQFIVSCASH